MKKKTKFNFHIKNKFRFASCCALVFAVFIFVLSIVTDTNVIAVSTKKVLNGLGIYTEEVKNVEIISDNYNNPGSWHIDKSAEWTGSNKARVTFDVNSIMKTGDRYKDVILVLDISGSMSGEKMDKAISDSKELVSTLLSDSHNRVALITFDSTSTVISEFSNDKDDLLEKLDAISVTGCTNYNAALQNVDVVMEGYKKESNRDVVTLFLTDGYPNEDTPNQVGTYEVLKDKYPYMAINGVQYEMGTDIIDEIEQITDSQWVANQSTLNNVLFDASISPVVYEDFIVTDYIQNDYFTIEKEDDIKVTIGTVKLEVESGVQKITWNLGKDSYTTGANAKMYIYLTFKQQYMVNETYYPTNKKESIIYKLPGENEKSLNSKKTPVLKNTYEVIYDTNTPDGCTLDSIPKEKYNTSQNVVKKTDKLSCEGYLFKGWEIDEGDEKDITKVNDDMFLMPAHDVYIRGTWTRQSIFKTMDGTVHEKTSLYKVLQEEATSGGLAREYTGAHQDSMDASGKEKIYHYYASNDTDGEAILNKNNVIFADHCWQMIRTTDTGGVKMIYNGEAEDGKCLSTRGTHVGYSGFSSASFTSDHWYGTDYTYDSVTKTFKLSGAIEQTTWNETTWPSLIGKYTCKNTNKDATCSTLYLVTSDYSFCPYSFCVGVKWPNVISLNSNSNYSQFGQLPFNSNVDGLSSAGYMYNTVYSPIRKDDLVKIESIFQKINIEKNNYYSMVSKSYVWDEESNSYNLVNPRQNQSSFIPVGSYVLRSDRFYYIAERDNNYHYAIELENGKDLNQSNDTYTFGDSYTDNGDGTYTINNPTTIERLSWFENYNNMNNKYVCKNATNNTCSSILYTIHTTKSQFYYIAVPSYKFSKGFTYSEGTYKLNNEQLSYYDIVNSTKVIQDDSPNVRIDKSYYTCFNATGECTTLSYVFLNFNSWSVSYINLTNGKSIEDAINEMLYDENVNQTDSSIKTGIDLWFKKYLLDYSDYLEDIIFCNDRSISELAGWDSNGLNNIDSNKSKKFIFKEYEPTNDLSCKNVTDQFSVSNHKAKLIYKVGLMTVPEMNILNVSSARKTGKSYWLGSPLGFGHYNIHMTNMNGVYDDGNFLNYLFNTNNGVRPAISLIPEIMYSEGDGSMENPYIVLTD